MKLLINLVEKIQHGNTLNEQESMISLTPLYIIMGFDTPEECVNHIKNNKK